MRRYSRTVLVARAILFSLAIPSYERGVRGFQCMIVGINRATAHHVQSRHAFQARLITGQRYTRRYRVWFVGYSCHR